MVTNFIKTIIIINISIDAVIVINSNSTVSNDFIKIITIIAINIILA